MKSISCNQCLKTFSNTEIISQTQTEGCASDVYTHNNQLFVMSHYGSKYDTSKFTVTTNHHHLKEGIICDDCIEKHIKDGTLVEESNFNYFESIEKFQKENTLINQKALISGSGYDRFKHEQQILSCWQICDDLKALTEGVMEKDMTPDQIANVLIGLEQLYQLKFEKLFSIFEKSLKIK